MDAKAKLVEIEAKRKEIAEKLKLKDKQLADKMSQLKVVVNREERKLDTRRKVLLGALMMELRKEDPAFDARVTDRLKTFLVRDIDRAAFGLDPLPASSKVAPAGEQTVVEHRPVAGKG